MDIAVFHRLGITVYPISVSMCIYVICNYGVGSDQLRRIELNNVK